MNDMSRAEAIEVLKDIISKPMLYSNHIIGACRVALASLQADEAYQLNYEKPEECEDCISRKAAIEAFKNTEDAEATSWHLTGIVSDLEDLPSVLPKPQFYPPCQDCNTKMDEIRKAYDKVSTEPKRGHWIVQPSNKEQGERDFIWWKCSECGQVMFSETEHDRLEFHAFCGRCGADMREMVEE